MRYASAAVAARAQWNARCVACVCCVRAKTRPIGSGAFVWVRCRQIGRADCGLSILVLSVPFYPIRIGGAIFLPIVQLHTNATQMHQWKGSQHLRGKRGNATKTAKKQEYQHALTHTECARTEDVEPEKRTTRQGRDKGAGASSGWGNVHWTGSSVGQRENEGQGRKKRKKERSKGKEGRQERSDPHTHRQEGGQEDTPRVRRCETSLFRAGIPASGFLFLLCSPPFWHTLTHTRPSQRESESLSTFLLLFLLPAACRCPPSLRL